MGNIFTKKLNVKDLFKLFLFCAVAFIIIFTAKCYLRGTVIVAVGDIAKAGGNHAEVAALILKMNPRKVITLGDNAYDKGTLEEFNTLYHPTFGKFKSKTAPSPGNHEYKTLGAAGYYEYFGTLAGPDRRGYYSFDIGSWHFISLNSEVLGPAQLHWLERDLSKNTKPCILAYSHKPLFSSGNVHGSDLTQKVFWDVLYKHGADLFLNGHEHTYERFKKQNPDGVADEKGIREIIVGTGGANTYSFKDAHPNSENRIGGVHGALHITLKNDGYTADFKIVTSSAVADTVSDTCN